MRKLDFKNIEFLWGIGLIVIGFALFVAIDSLIRYVGIVFIILAIALLARNIFSKASNSEDEKFKSRTRDRIYKYQHKQ
jgi:membrane-bound ClpP family serine protease